MTGTLNITQAPLTITADNQSKVYGAELPTLTASYSGFVNGDTPANLDTGATLSTTATASSDTGIYSIIVSGAVDRDYAISFVDGTMTVTAASLTITADNQTKVYGAALPTLTAVVLGLCQRRYRGQSGHPPTLTRRRPPAAMSRATPTPSRPAMRSIRTTASATWTGR